MEKCDSRTRAYQNGKTFDQCREIAKTLSLELEEKIKNFLPVVDELFEKVGCGGMITMERIEIIKYTQGK